MGYTTMSPKNINPGKRYLKGYAFFESNATFKPIRPAIKTARTPQPFACKSPMAAHKPMAFDIPKVMTFNQFLIIG